MPKFLVVIDMAKHKRHAYEVECDDVDEAIEKAKEVCYYSLRDEDVKDLTKSDSGYYTGSVFDARELRSTEDLLKGDNY